MSCDEISADWAAQRIKGLSLGAAILDGLRRSLGRKKSASIEGSPKTLIECFRYPRRGPGMMWEAAAEKLKAMGGRVVMGRTLEHLAFDEVRRQWTIVVTCAEGARETFVANEVVSSAKSWVRSRRRH